MNIEKVLYSVPELIATTGLGRSTLYLAMASGKLEPRKIGRRTMVTREALDRFVASLPVGLDPNDGPLTNNA